jgi:hypothetical protein
LRRQTRELVFDEVELILDRSEIGTTLISLADRNLMALENTGPPVTLGQHR